MDIGVGPVGTSGLDGQDVVLDLALSVGLPGEPGLPGADGADSAPGTNGMNQTQYPNPLNGQNGQNGLNSANSPNGARGPACRTIPWVQIFQTAVAGTSATSSQFTTSVSGQVVTFIPAVSGLYRVTANIINQSPIDINLNGPTSGVITNNRSGVLYINLIAGGSYTATLGGLSTNYQLWVDAHLVA